MLKLANEILHKLWPSCSIQWVTALLKWHLSWDGSIFVLRCRTAPGCSLFISLATLPKFRDSRWGQRKSSISSGPICAHILPKKKKELSSTIIALLQWCYYHAIKLCNSRLQEIDLIIIWQICQERKIRPGKFLCHRLRFKASVHTSERLLELRWCKIFNTDFFKCTLTQDLNPTDSSLFDPVGSVWLSEAYKLVQIQI